MDEQKKKEMDLVDLLCAVWKWFGRAFGKVTDCLTVLMRFAWRKKIGVCLSTIAVFAGICAFYVNQNNVKRFTAESQMLIMVSDAFLVNDMLNGLNYLCLTRQCDQVAKLMNISKEDASAIKGIHSYFWTDERHDFTPTRVDYKQSYLQDTSIMRMSDRLQIEIEMSQMELVGKLADGLRYFVTEANYTSTRREREVRKLSRIEQEFDKQASVLDSLKHIEYFVNSVPKVQIDGPMIVSSKDKQLYHDQILALRSQAENLRIDIEKQKESISFTHDFVLKKGSNHMIKDALFYSILFFIAATILLYVIDKRKNIVDFLEKDE